ncbi:MAG: DUF123 domain-containing protein [Alphaproteobacteria bacterium]|nr:DUF123 domain-containing protein [Alphaproteobacteria bacterium]
MIADWLYKMQGDELLKRSGSYVLLIELENGFEGSVGMLGEVNLLAGRYLYFGSARGPGGMAARINRHLRSDKKPHWHIDRITLAGQVSEILAVPEDHECDLREKAMALMNLTVPVKGFGSSDCNRCPAHLLAISGDSTGLFARLVETVGGKIYPAMSLLPTTAAQPSTV